MLGLGWNELVMAVMAVVLLAGFVMLMDRLDE